MSVSSPLRAVKTPLQAELAAMQEIADLIAPFDPATRARVLHWAAERFNTDTLPRIQAPASPAALQLVPPPSPVVDEGLEIAAWDELFDPREPQRAEPEPSEPTINGTLHEFVVEFQDIVREWSVACGELETEPDADADRASRS